MSSQWIDELMQLVSGRGLVSIENIVAAQRLKQQHFPKALFKYRDVTDYALANLRDRSLFMAVASSFNDPYDSAASFDPAFGSSHAELLLDRLPSIAGQDRETILSAGEPVREVIRHLSLQTGAAGMVEEEVLAKIAKGLQEMHQTSMVQILTLMNQLLQNTYKMCSLTERLDSLPLWAHYANNHAGFAMEYDFQQLPSDDLMGLSLWPVRYTGVFDASEMLHGYLATESFNNLFALVAALHKSPDWAYEEEWRVVIVDGSDDPPRNFRAPLKAVHMGAKITDEHAEAVVQAAQVAGVPVFKMQLVPHEFRMESVAYRSQRAD